MCSNISNINQASDFFDSAHHFEEKQNMIRRSMPVVLNRGHMAPQGAVLYFAWATGKSRKNGGGMETVRWATKISLPK
jgi:hypothetical protein